MNLQAVLTLLAIHLSICCFGCRENSQSEFSIIAVDPVTGICGAAVASRYPNVAYARPGVGAFCTQHWHNPAWGEKALDVEYLWTLL